MNWDDYDDTWSPEKKIEWINSVDSEILRHTTVRDIADFSKVEEAFLTCRDFINQINIERVRTVQAHLYSSLITFVNNVIAITQSVSQANFHEQNVAGMRDRFFNEYQQHLNDISGQFRDHYPTLLKSGLETKNLSEQKIGDMQKSMNEMVSEAEKKIEQLDAIVSAATETAAKTGIAKEAHHFATESEKHRETSKKMAPCSNHRCRVYRCGCHVFLLLAAARQHR